jgi:hypothetical protein
MKKATILTLISAFVLVGSASYANNIGCGLGAVLLKGKQGRIFELLGTCLNGTCANQTFAITFGTLGYKEGAAIGMNVEVENFVAQNMDSLATDMAKGNGEYLDTLASLMKADDKTAFSTKMKANFNSIYTSSAVTSTEVVANIYRVANS